MEQTLALIKPDAVNQNLQGEIIAMIQKNGFIVKAMKMLHFNSKQAEAFYAVHNDKYFFHDLVNFMCSGPIVCLILEAPNAVAKYRELMGSTDPLEAKENTIRKIYAKSMRANAVHGSDSLENAQIEIDFFFSKLERI